MICKHKKTTSQNGVVLIMGLILLVAISLVAMYTLRSTLTGEQVSKNLRSQSMAMQSAETALRICENAVRGGLAQLGSGSDAVNFIVIPTPESWDNSKVIPDQWRTRASWTSTNPQMATQIPSSLIGSSEMRPLPPPRCMVEQYELPVMGEDKTVSQPFLVTVIGYSADYRADANGNTVSGSEVWIQSVLRP
jgi:type IV pilus assembly protein PilX